MRTASFAILASSALLTAAALVGCGGKSAVSPEGPQAYLRVVNTAAAGQSIDVLVLGSVVVPSRRAAASFASSILPRRRRRCCSSGRSRTFRR